MGGGFDISLEELALVVDNEFFLFTEGDLLLDELVFLFDLVL